MRKIIFLFCCLLPCLFQAEASNSRELPPITIRFNNQSLDSALSQLEKEYIEQGGRYRFFYHDTIVNKSNRINQNFRDKTIVQILNVLLANSDYSYFTIGYRVFVYKEKDNLITTAENKELEPFSITGTVVDENGKPLLGATICIKEEDAATAHTAKEVNEGSDFRYCTQSDYDGSFTISTTNLNTYIIVLYLGYFPRVVHIQDAGLIQLEPDLEILNKVFRIGSTIDNRKQKRKDCV
jgi:hypothetical protein